MEKFLNILKKIGVWLLSFMKSTGVKFLNILKKIGVWLLSFIKSRRVGFYFGFVASIISIVFGFYFLGKYGQSIYMDKLIVILPIVSAVVCIALLFVTPIEGIGPMILGAGTTVTFAIFMHKTYSYLSEVFYGGFNAESLAAMKTEYAVCFIFSLVSIIFAIVAIFTRKSKKVEEVK